MNYLKLTSVLTIILTFVSCTTLPQKGTFIPKDETSYLSFRDSIIKNGLKNLSAKKQKKYKNLHIRIWTDYYCYKNEYKLAENIFQDYYNKNKNLWGKLFKSQLYYKQGKYKLGEIIKSDIFHSFDVSEKSDKSLLLLKAFSSKIHNEFFFKNPTFNSLPKEQLNKMEIDRNANFYNLEKLYPEYADIYFARAEKSGWNNSLEDYFRAEKLGLKHYLLFSKIRNNYMLDDDNLINQYSTKALNIEPNLSNILAYKSEKLFKEGKYKEALKDALKAVEAQPTYWFGLIMKVRSLTALNKNQEALKTANKLIKLKPSFYWPPELRGDVKVQLEDFKGAIKDFKTSFKKRSKRIHLAHKIARIYNRISETDKAIEYFSKLEGLWGTHGHIISHIISNDLDKAKNLLIDATKENKDWIYGQILLKNLTEDKRNFQIEGKNKEEKSIIDLLNNKISLEECIKNINDTNSQNKEVKILFFNALNNLTKGNIDIAKIGFRKVLENANPISHEIVLAKYFLSQI